MTPFEELLNRSLEIHKKKREDYTTRPDLDPYENFARANEIVSWFPPEYKSFASHIGTKLARIASLLSNSRKPNNESLEDSFLDLVTYCGLMYGFYESRKGIYINGEFVTDQHKIDATLYASNRPTTIDRKVTTEIFNATLKTKDSPDPTEPCPHIYVDIFRKCKHCLQPITKTDLNLFYYKTSLGDFVKSKP